MRFLAAVLFFCALGLAQQPETPQPFEVKGIKLGSSLAQSKEKGLTCLSLPSDKTPSDEYVCLVPNATYAGLSVSEMAMFYKDRLASIYFKFGQDKFETLKDALQQKFGKPASTEVKTYQNAYGAKFTGEYIVWSNGVSTITLEEMGGSRDQSVLLFSHTEIAGEQLKAKKAKAKPDDM